MDSPHGPWLQSEPLVSEVLDFDIVVCNGASLARTNWDNGKPCGKERKCKIARLLRKYADINAVATQLKSAAGSRHIGCVFACFDGARMHFKQAVS